MIELIVVILIIGILIGLASVQVVRFPEVKMLCDVPEQDSVCREGKTESQPANAQAGMLA